ncbi:MAG TPA: ABC-three component system protein [Streptosporangiaceae bacterium]|nr:ABC-three component system protein [Streptosporangiaceae bacterium]
MRKELRPTTFELFLDWPGLPNGLRVRRSGAQAAIVTLDPDISASRDLRLMIGEGTIPVTEWNQLIEEDLYGLRGEHPGVTGRTLLSFAMRRSSSHAFNEPQRSHSRQSEAEAATNLAYLLGLDWQLASRYRDLAAREATRIQLRKAVNDPIWGRIVGTTADLRGQATVAQARVERLRAQIQAFRVVPQCEELKIRADDLNRQVQQLGNDDVIDQANLDQLEQAVQETTDTEVRYLEPVYLELGIVLGDQVRRRFDDVRAFHESVVRNRRAYLSEEIETRRARLVERQRQRAQLGGQQAAILRQLNEGGALDALTTLQQAMAREEANLTALRNRLEAAQTLEASSLQIRSERVELQQEISTDLNERQVNVNEVTLLFDQYAQRLYGTGRRGYLAIDPGPSSLKITPRIETDESHGIGHMAIFCFDLTVAVIAHRQNRGPDFLVHDSHIFDGVDDRQVTRALELAAETCIDENMQYIATINSDDLAKAESRGFISSQYIVEPRLTDASEDGGLFGFRF